VDDEFGISAAAEFVKVHAESFAVGINAQWKHAIENLENQVDEGQEEPEQRGDADELREKLALLGREEAGSGEPPEAGGSVNADGAGGIVDGERELKQLDEQRGNDAGH